MNAPAQKTLYERIGGADAVSATVVRLYQKILSDEALIPFFDGISVERLRASQIAFITVATGGPNRYTGQNMRDAHKKLLEKGLNDNHFNRVAKHLAASMAELGVDQKLIDEALAIVETTRNDVLGKS